MRNGRRFLTVMFFGLAGWCSIAGAQDIKTPMADQIRLYERSVQTPSEQNNGAAWWKLAMLYQDSARYRDAERAYTKAIELLTPGDGINLANAMDCMGTMYVEIGEFAQADSLEHKALALRVQQNDSVGVGLSWMHLAMLSLGKHEVEEGAAYAELAVERLVAEHEHKPQGLVTPEQKMTALTYLALARCSQHNCRAALGPLQKAQSVARSNYPEKSFPAAYIDFLMGFAQWKLGDDRSAARLMKAGTAGMEEQMAWGHPTYLSAMNQYAEFLLEKGHNAEAAEVKAKIARMQASPAKTQMASVGGKIELPQ